RFYEIVCIVFFCFFFSSRRRHTRSKRDWSSDVCSSDLNILEMVGVSAISQKKREYHPEVSSTGPLSHETPISAVQTNAVSRFASCAKRGYPCALSQPKSNAQ